jgi:hypothetical protein
MALSPDRDLEELRAAAARHSWAHANFTSERTHTNVLAGALNKGRRPEAHRLAAALWHMGGGSMIPPEEITAVSATTEHRLKPGPQGTVDLSIAIEAGGVERQLAVEVKVDSVPWAGQLASMHAALGGDPNRRLALLCIGASQVSRIEPDGTKAPTLPRWLVANLLGLRELVLAAAPSPAEAATWLDELDNEEKRRRWAWANEASLEGCGYRRRLRNTYRYGEAAMELAASGSEWEVSLQPFGVILHGKSSQRAIAETGAIRYLEVAGGALRVKVGAWDEESRSPLQAAELVRPRIAKSFQAGGFAVQMAKKSAGASMTLMTIDPAADDWPREAFIDRLRRAIAVWDEIDRS